MKVVLKGWVYMYLHMYLHMSMKSRKMVGKGLNFYCSLMGTKRVCKDLLALSTMNAFG